MANLPMSPHRGLMRSRTYVGIAGAMAMQWMPVVLDYCRRTPSRPATSAASLLSQARDRQSSQVAPVGSSSSSEPSNVSSVAAIDMEWRPWLGSPRSSLLPVRPARMIRKVRNRWRVWTAVRGAQGSISYAWLPLSPSLASALDAEVRLHSSAVEEEPLPILAPPPSPSSSSPFVPMPPLLETCASVSFPDTFTPEGWHAALRLTWSGQERLALLPTPPSRLGLGALPDLHPPLPPLDRPARRSVAEVIADHKQRHAAFVPSGFALALGLPAVVAWRYRRGLSPTRRRASTPVTAYMFAILSFAVNPLRALLVISSIPLSPSTRLSPTREPAPRL